MGNSEVGHLNLGAGAVVKQDLARIDDAIADGSFFENEALLAACERGPLEPARAPAPDRASSPTAASTRAGSTSRRCIELAAREGVPDLVVHAFTDGRDTLPHGGAAATSQELERWLRHAGRIGTVGGRYYAMDRDRRWERTQARLRRDRPRRGPARGERRARRSRDAYERGETDEFVQPTVIGDYDGVADGDVVAPLQLPARPGAPAVARARRARLRRVRPRPARPASSSRR